MKKKRSRKKTGIAVAVTAILLAALSLLDFNILLRRTEEKRTYDAMKHWAQQEAASLEFKTEKYYSLLKSASVYLSGHDFGSEAMDTYLEIQEAVQGADFELIGVSDVNGLAVDMDGRTSEISEYKFFKKGMQGQPGCISFEKNGEGYVAFYVPVYEEDQKTIKGIIYGALPGEKLDVFKVTPKEIQLQGICITDSNGTYILKRGEGCGFEENIFEDLERMGSSIHIERIQDLINSGMASRSDVKFENNKQHMIIVPANKHTMFVAAAISEKAIGQKINVYQRYVVYLSLKLVLIIVVLICIYLFNQKEERQYIRKINARLLLDEETYKITSKRCELCIFTYDRENEQVHFLNDKYKDFGMDQESLSVPLLLQKIAKKNPQACAKLQGLIDSSREHKLYDNCKIAIRRNGQTVYWKVYVTNLYDAEGKFARAVGSVEDITNYETDRMNLRKEMDFRNSLLADCMGYMVVDATEDLVVDCDNKIIKNMNTERYSYTQVLEGYMSKRVAPEYWNELTEKMGCEGLRVLGNSEGHKRTVEYISDDGHGEQMWMSCEIHADLDETKGHIMAYLVYRNIDKKKRSQELLKQQAQIDILTGISNRASGSEQIEVLLKKERPEGRVHAFVMVDLDNFKQLNDSFGHMWGDKALYETACIMRKHCRENDVVCRLGGDEFVAFLYNIPREVVKKNIEALSRKLHIRYEKKGMEIEVSASIGVAIVPEHGETFKEIYETADRALYKVKKEAKGGYCISGNEVENPLNLFKKTQN